MTLRGPGTALPAAMRFPGLAPDRRYTVRPLTVGTPPRTLQDAPPAWLRQGTVTLPGRVLTEVGLPPPLLMPAQAAVFIVDAIHTEHGAP